MKEGSNNPNSARFILWPVFTSGPGSGWLWVSGAGSWFISDVWAISWSQTRQNNQSGRSSAVKTVKRWGADQRLWTDPVSSDNIFIVKEYFRDGVIYKCCHIFYVLVSYYFIEWNYWGGKYWNTGHFLTDRQNLLFSLLVGKQISWNVCFPLSNIFVTQHNNKQINIKLLKPNSQLKSSSPWDHISIQTESSWASWVPLDIPITIENPWPWLVETHYFFGGSDLLRNSLNSHAANKTWINQ